MSTEFKREERYIVFKLSDVEEHFTPGEKQQLARLAEVQRVGREEAGKAPLECVVVEADWPEYEPTWKAIQARMTGAHPAPRVPEDVMRDVEWKRELFIIKHAMAMNSWDWKSEASNDMKREAYAAVVKLLAAAPEAKP